MSKYPFKILSEEATNQDLYANGAHQRIADSLFHVIENNKEGITIGLEGEYGSGKSSVIRILKEKLDQQEESYTTFYFDAWAHESDPLRRVFLESMIEKCFGSNDVDIRAIKENIKFNKETNESPKVGQISKFAIFFALSIFFVPLGIHLLGLVDYSRLSFDCISCNFHWIFIGGIFLSLLPVFLTLMKFLFIARSKTKGRILDISNWHFIDGKITTDDGSKVVLEQERTSIEFQEYFNQILKLLFSDNQKKLIIILDNLDRVDQEQALKVFSTLQIFLQHRNSLDNVNPFHQRIFTIIPYDESGIMKLWGTDNNKQENDSKENSTKNLFESYLDKLLQLRISVPKPVLKSWKEASKKLITDTFKKWKINDRNDVINVFFHANTSPSFNPKPREMKVYINQVGILRNHFDEVIFTESIALYVMKRYVEKQSIDEVKKNLLNNSIGYKEGAFLRIKDSIDIQKQLAAIIFDVKDLNDAAVLLLEEEIAVALFDKNAEKIAEIEANNRDNFWYVLHHILKEYDDQNIYNYMGFIYDCFGNDKKRLHPLIFRANNIIKRQDILFQVNGRQNDTQKKNIIACFQLSTNENKIELWKKLVLDILTRIQFIEENKESIAKLLKELNFIYEEVKELVEYNKTELPKNFNWQLIAEIDFENNLKLSEVLSLSKEVKEKYIKEVDDIIKNKHNSKSFDITDQLLFLEKTEIFDKIEILELIHKIYFTVKNIEKVEGSPEGTYFFRFKQSFTILIYKISIVYNNSSLMREIVTDSDFYFHTLGFDEQDRKKIYNIAVIRLYILKDEFFEYKTNKNPGDTDYIEYEIFKLFESADHNFIEYFIMDIRKNSMWREFWQICRLKKSPILSALLIQLAKERSEEPFSFQVEFNDYLNCIYLLKNENTEISDIKQFHDWFFDYSSNDMEDLSMSILDKWTVDAELHNQEVSNFHTLLHKIGMDRLFK